MRRKSTSPGQYVFNEFLEAVDKKQENYQQLLGYLAVRNAVKSKWERNDVIPPNSLIDAVCTSFRMNSNVPLEIPFALVLHLISGVLLRKGVHVKTSCGIVYPKIWTIVLGNSSSGKTFAHSKVISGLGISDPEIDGFAGAVSAAACFMALKQSPTGLVIRDEFGQFIGQIENNLHLADFKDLLLRIFDGNRLTRMTKKEGILEIENPQVSILGLTQYDTWHLKVSPESLMDGFAARFSLLIAKKDPSRMWQDWPSWRIDTSGWRECWEHCLSVIKNEYHTTAEAEAVFEHQFRSLAKDKELPESFFRRVLFSCHRLACIYHILTAKTTPEIDAEDYGWAMRLVEHHLDDAIQVLGEQNFSEIERIFQKAKLLRDKCLARGEHFSERTLYRNIRGLMPASAIVIMRLLKESDQNELKNTD